MVPPDPISGGLILSGVGAKRVSETLLSDLYKIAKNKGKFAFQKKKASKHADLLHKRVRQLRQVKTILQSEREVDLIKFYYPSRVLIGNVCKEVDRLSDLDCDANVLIEGTVGQGKSIFLRYLASVEFFMTRRIPVFIELRKIKTSESLLTFILEEMTTLGFDVDEQLFRFLADEGKVLLMLDGFDEVIPELRETLLSEIETFARRHEALRIVVTSRADSGISTSSSLRVFKLCPLQGNEYEHVIRKITHDDATATAIITGIKRDAVTIVNLLTTPLMVALLVIRFRIDQTLPHNIAAFYESLFILLLQRHDKTKGGYTRHRKSKLSDSELETFFNALAFLTRKKNETSFSRSELNTFGSESLRLAGFDATVDRVLADIIEVTCLLLAEGDERRFIHKSVQEYHAAVFIKDQPDATAIAFYEAMKQNWRRWHQELNFLEIIDRYRFLKHFHIPQLRSLLGVTGDIPDDIPLTKEELVQRCGQDALSFREKEPRERHFTFYSTGHLWPTSRIILRYDYSNDFFKLDFGQFDRATFHEESPDTLMITVGELMADDRYSSTSEAACRKFLGRLIPELREAEAYVKHVDDRKEAFTF